MVIRSNVVPAGYDRRFSLVCPPRAASHGHQRSIAVIPVISRCVPVGQHFAGQDHDRCPTFQAGVSEVTCRVTGGASRRWRFTFDFAGSLGAAADVKLPGAVVTLARRPR
jgi:hypothetical protein